MSLFKNYIVTALLISSAFFSCTRGKSIVQQPSVQLPDSFAVKSDTSSIADFPVDKLFKDSVLVELIRTAVANNQDVLIAAQRIEASKASLIAARGAYLPSLFFDATGGVRKFGDYTMDGVGNFDTNLSNDLPREKKIPNPYREYFLGFRSSWELDVWGKLRNQKRGAYARMLAAEKGRHWIITSLIAEVASTYYALLALDAELDIIRKNSIIQSKAVETTLHLKEGGITNDLAVSQLTAQLLNTQSLEIRTKQLIIETENKINLLLGRLPQPIVRGIPLSNQQLPDMVHAGVPSQLLTNRPDIRMAELNLRASHADLKSARAAFLPSFNITAFAGRNAFTTPLLSNPGSLAYGLFGGMLAPLFNKKINKANYRSAKASNQEAYLSYQRAIINGYTEVSTTLNYIENIRKVNKIIEEEVDVLEKGVNTSNDLFIAGYASYLEVLNAQRNVLAAELELATTKKDQFLGIINLYKALGGGWK